RNERHRGPASGPGTAPDPAARPAAARGHGKPTGAGDTGGTGDRRDGPGGLRLQPDRPAGVDPGDRHQHHHRPRRGLLPLVVFRQKPANPVSPRALLDASVKAYQTSLGATADQQEVREVGGMRAMWMIVTGKGTGAAIDGKGAVPTTAHWVAIPRSKDTL